MSTQNEQAALLAEQAAHALAAARKSFINAADVADDVDSDLRRCENEIYELPNQAMLALRNTDKSERHLRIANEAADGIELRVRHGQAGLLKVRDHLDDGSRALDAGRQILAELEQLPGQQSDATDHLRSRLDRLGHAVRDAEKGVEQAGTRGYARISTRPGRMPPPPRGRAPSWRWRPGPPCTRHPRPHSAAPLGPPSWTCDDGRQDRRRVATSKGGSGNAAVTPE